MSYQNDDRYFDATQEPKKVINKGTLSFVRIFGYMSIGLLITFGFAVLLSFILIKSGVTYQNSSNLILGLTIGSLIALVITSIVISRVLIKGNRSLVVPSIIYCLIFGVVFTPLILLVPYQIMLMAFAITIGMFLIMTLLAFLTKGRVGGLVIAAGALGLGLGIAALFSLLFLPLINMGRSQPVGYGLVFGINAAMFALIMLITIIDIARIKSITDSMGGEVDRNLELSLALTIYTDFIMILLRVIYYLLIIFGKNH